LRFVYLNRFVDELSLFFNHGDMAEFQNVLFGSDDDEDKKKQKDKESSSQASSTPLPTLNAASVSKPSPFTKHSFTLSNVELWVPAGTSSPQYMTARIDGMKLYTSPQEDEGIPYQTYVMVVYAFICSTRTSELQHSLNRMMAVRGLTMVQSEFVHKKFSLTRFEFNDIACQLTLPQYHFIFAMWYGNLEETAVFMKRPDPRKSEVADPPASTLLGPAIRNALASPKATPFLSALEPQQPQTKAEEMEMLSRRRIEIEFPSITMTLYEDEGWVLDVFLAPSW